jgi:hypothetical protein
MVKQLQKDNSGTTVLTQTSKPSSGPPPTRCATRPSTGRDRIGGLLLLPKSFNASYGELPFAEKCEHYAGQNLLAKSLQQSAYDYNPGFKGFLAESGLPFRAHVEFKKADIDALQALYQELAERIWSPERLV